MSRHLRNTVIQALLESVYGDDPGGWAATDAMLISNATFKIDRDLVPRDLIRGYYGGSEHLTGTRRVEIDFEVELAGSGAAGSAPVWGRLLRACGLAETLFAADRAEYTPVSTGFESNTFRYFLDGVRYISRGVRGTVMFDMNISGRPLLKFRMKGFDTSANAEAIPATDFSTWQQPQVITDQNTGDLLFGATYAAGAFTGGTIYKSRGLEIDLGNSVNHLEFLGGEEIDIGDREITGKTAVVLSAAQEVTWRDEVNANALTSVGFTHGTAAGNRISVFAPSVQRVSPNHQDYQGRLLMQTDLRLLPVTGNDDMRLVVH